MRPFDDSSSAEVRLLPNSQAELSRAKCGTNSTGWSLNPLFCWPLRAVLALWWGGWVKGSGSPGWGRSPKATERSEACLLRAGGPGSLRWPPHHKTIRSEGCLVRRGCDPSVGCDGSRHHDRVGCRRGWLHSGLLDVTGFNEPSGPSGTVPARSCPNRSDVSGKPLGASVPAHHLPAQRVGA